MTRKILFVFIAFIAANAYSQTAFVDGYFINNNNEKVICKIKDLDWRINPTTFEYIVNDDATPQNATIENVKEFGIDNISKYVRKTVNIDRSSEHLNKMSTEKNPIFKEETLFLMLLVEGPANLYEYRGEGNLKRYFYSQNDGEIEQLVFKSYRNSEFTSAENNYYRQQLWNDLKCDKITMRKIEGVGYGKKDLAKFFTDYNECNSGKSVAFKDEGRASFFNLSLRAHLNNASGTVKNNTIADQDIDFGSNIGISVGAEIEFILGFNNNKWGIIAEPTYHKFEANKTITSTSVSGGKLNAKMEYSSIEVPIGVRHFFFLNDNSKLFVNASYVFDFSSKSSILFTRENGTEIDKLDIESGNSFAIGAGYRYKGKYSVELRLITPRDLLAEYNFWEAKYNAASLIVGYTIF